jgi:hypothetical protein
MTKFSGSLPKGDLNGLTALSNQLLRNPKGTHIIVGVIDVKTITTDVDTSDQIATVRFRRVEAIDPADADHAVRMMQRAAERRTGAAMLPIEMEDELRELMDALDFETGELFDGDDPANVNPDVTPDQTADNEGDNEPAQPAETPRETPPAVPAEPGPDESETREADAAELPPAEAPAETPSPEQEPPKKKRGRPTKAEAAAKKAAAEAAAAAPIEDLAAADVPRAPWDDEPAAGMYPDHESE